ncbi:MAG: hypothetical protein M0R66_01370 [Candidatus Omnitrophica bacterium]|nr:hypothetical protein [Candidatus Omnitrophota bacterium]
MGPGAKPVGASGPSRGYIAGTKPRRAHPARNFFPETSRKPGFSSNESTVFFGVFSTRTNQKWFIRFLNETVFVGVKTAFFPESLMHNERSLVRSRQRHEGNDGFLNGAPQNGGCASESSGACRAEKRLPDARTPEKNPAVPFVAGKKRFAHERVAGKKVGGLRAPAWRSHSRPLLHSTPILVDAETRMDYKVSERASHGGSATGQAGAVEARRGVVG